MVDDTHSYWSIALISGTSIGCMNKALRHVENLFIQRFLFIHPRVVFIVQGSLFVVQ